MGRKIAFGYFICFFIGGLVTLPVVSYDVVSEFGVLSAWDKTGLVTAIVAFGMLLLLKLTSRQRNKDLARMEEALQQSDRHYRELVETAGSIILRCNLKGELTYINEYGLSFFGYEATELIGRKLTETIVSPRGENGGERLKQFNQLLEGRDAHKHCVMQNRLKGGKQVWISWSNKRIRNGAGELEGMLCIGMDFTEHKQLEERLSLEAAVFKHAREGVLITDPAGVILDCNQAFSRITGYAADEVIGEKPSIMSSGEHTPEFYKTMWRHIRKQGYWSGDIYNRRKSGEVYVEMLTISTVKNSRGQVECYVALFADITEMRTEQKKLELVAHHDVLTGLPNRFLFQNRLRQAMQSAEKNKRMMAVVFVDLDGFKSINDTFGHNAGDYLLKEISARMKNVIRSCDMLARLGGDEFVVLLAELNADASVTPILERLLESASETVLYENKEMQVSASLGVSYYPQQSMPSLEQLIHQSDKAMYRAKQAGKNRYCIADHRL